LREYVAVPANFTVPDDWSCVQSAYDRAENTPENVAFQKPVDGRWTDVTNREFAEEVRTIARGLVALGVRAGDRVALLSSTRYEWNLIDFAIWAVGAVTVPVYDSSSADQIHWIMEDSAARLIIVENDIHATTAREGVQGLEVADVLVIDGATPVLETLASEGATVDVSVLDERRASVRADSPATLIYTSGTTGRPKGVMLSHRNFMSETLAVLETPFSGILRDDATSVMFLPLAHVLARSITYAGFHAGVTIAHSSDLTNLVETFGEMKPHYILAVPRVFQKVFNKAQATAQDGGTVKAWMFDKAADTAVAYSKANRGDGRVGPLLGLRHAIFSKLVYGKLVNALGGRCEVAISGGAALGDRLTHFFDGIGVNIFEGYGLTETCAAITVNTPGRMRIGSVGQPLPGCAVRIAQDGEVEVSGPVVASGYWQNKEATAESFSDGWFRTGDLGSLDEDGYLSITGRKKEIIVTAGGKNVAPNQLEDALRADPLVAEAVCVGDGKPFVSALLTLDPEAVERWKTHHDKSGSLYELLKDADLIEHLDQALVRANRSVSHSESIKKYHVLPDQFTEETGELTASLKVKRNVVHQKYAQQIESLYA